MKATIVNIQRFSIHDGPGIRTVVFFKGCPLACLWCDNPECIKPFPQLGFSRILCNRCGNCFPACAEGAIAADKDGIPRINRRRCTNCGQCVSVCPQKALLIYGREMTLDELFEEVCRDRKFFEHSGGGVTVSGGEPIRQADFVRALFEKCREAGISTAVETCGCVDSEDFRKVLEYTDFLFFDLKVLDEPGHRKLTGKSNRLILENARIAAGKGVPMQFRLPLIPGLNDDFDNIRATSEFLTRLTPGHSFSIELMPYHRLGTGKYQALGRKYSLKDLESASPEAVELARQRFEKQGISCLVSG